MRRPIALVTGATAGIGYWTAAALARAGAHVLLTGRDERRGMEAVARVRQLARHDDVELLLFEASTVRANLALAEQVGRRVDRVDVLVNNVGGTGDARWRDNGEGIESTLALNFVGPFALTTALLPLLSARRGAQVVNVVSSAFAMWKREVLEDVESLEHVAGFQAYARAKALNLIFVLALARRLAGTGVLANAVNPGMAWTPGIAALTRDAVPQWRYIWPIVRWFHRRASAERAARGPIALATALELDVSGAYFDGTRRKRVPAAFVEVELQERVWSLGQAMVAKSLARCADSDARADRQEAPDAARRDPAHTD